MQKGEPGPAGPPGPTGIIGWQIVPSDIKTIGADIPYFDHSVNCPEGFRVTGGGFSASSSVTVIESIPLQDLDGNGIGWQVVGAVTGIGEASLQVWAVCGRVQQGP